MAYPINDAVAATIAPPISEAFSWIPATTGNRAFINLSQAVPGYPPAEALIVGVGAQGLLMALALGRRGVRAYVSDPNAARVAFAVGRLGALELGPDDDRQFELSVDTAGVPEALAQAVRQLPPAVGRVDASALARV